VVKRRGLRWVRKKDIRHNLTGEEGVTRTHYHKWATKRKGDGKNG